MARYLESLGDIAYEGLDVSVYQGIIDFARVRAAGRTAVYIRASLGEDYVDPRFEQNYAGARENGLLVGFYHYITARDTAAAAREARFFVGQIRGKHVDMRLAMDFEQFGNLSNAQINDIARTFLDTITVESGKEAVIYTGASRARTLWSAELANDYPLWVAEYGAALPAYNDKWAGWVGFQYTDRGRVDGISGNVDLDRFTKGILVSDASAIPGTPSPKPSTGTKLICVTVRRGDTLSALAREYGTTVQSLVQLNDLADPNRIRAGESLYVRVASDREGNCCDTYEVQRGDTLTAIARRFGTTVSRLAGINHLSNPDVIHPGQTLILGQCG